MNQVARGNAIKNARIEMNLSIEDLSRLACVGAEKIRQMEGEVINKFFPVDERLDAELRIYKVLLEKVKR